MQATVVKATFADSDMANVSYSNLNKKGNDNNINNNNFSKQAQKNHVLQVLNLLNAYSKLKYTQINLLSCQLLKTSLSVS